MSEIVNDYEMMVIMKPLLPDDIRNKIHKTITDLVSELGGRVVDVDVWGKRFLAYKIKQHNEGYYIVYLFKLPRKNINELRRKLQFNSEIIRFLVIKVDNLDERIRKIKKKEIDLKAFTS